MADKNRVKTKGSTSVNRLRTILPAVNGVENRQKIPDSNLQGQELKRLYFRKAIPKKKVKKQNGKLLEGGSMHQLRRNIQYLQYGWDSRFILDHIPTLYPKEKSSSVSKRKPSTKQLTTGLNSSTNKNARQSIKSLRAVSRYYTSARQDTTKVVIQREVETVAQTKDASVVKLGTVETAKGLVQRRDRIYRMESIYMQKEIPHFHKAIIKSLFSHLKSEEQANLSKLSIRQFKDFFDSVDSAVMATNQREEALLDLKTVINEILKKDDSLVNLKEEVEPILYEVSMSTLNSIENIVRWREKVRELADKYKINSIDPESLIYEYQKGKSYLSKIIEDTQPLHESKLYPEAKFPDPFFLSYNLGKIYEDRDLVYKVRASQLLILQESINCC